LQRLATTSALAFRSPLSVRVGRRTVLLFAGVLLAAAATLKALAAIGDAASLRHMRMPAYVEAPLIVWEVGLFTLLLVKRFERVAWMLALPTFAVFCAVSLRSVNAGQPSCCCLGIFDADPRLMLAIDSVTLVALFCCRPPAAEMSMVATLAAATLAYLIWPTLILEKKASTHLLLPVVDTDKSDDHPLVTSAGGLTEWAYSLRNSSSEQLTLADVKTSCDCLSLRLSTNQLNPGGVCRVAAGVDLRQRPQFTGSLRLRAFVRVNPPVNDLCVLDHVMHVTAKPDIGWDGR